MCLPSTGLIPGAKWTNAMASYRRGYSTERAVPKIISDLLMAIDRWHVCNNARVAWFICRVWYDRPHHPHQSSPSFFWNTEHRIVLDRAMHLQQNADSQFLCSFSSKSPLTCGVPQESVLGHVHFLLYTSDLITIARRHGIGTHSYANNTQLYRHAIADLCVVSA